MMTRSAWRTVSGLAGRPMQAAATAPSGCRSHSVGATLRALAIRPSGVSFNRAGASAIVMHGRLGQQQFGSAQWGADLFSKAVKHKRACAQPGGHRDDRGTGPVGLCGGAALRCYPLKGWKLGEVRIAAEPGADVACVQHRQKGDRSWGR